VYDRLEAHFELEQGQVLALLRRSEALSYTMRRTRRSGCLIRKRRAGRKSRVAWEPSDELKLVQRKIRDQIETRFRPHKIAHAYVESRSIITGAQMHVGKTFLLHLDIRNFFGAIKEHVVFQHLKRMFGEFDNSDIEALTKLCCHRGCLSFGAPISPILSNLICSQFDTQIYALANLYHCDVTRYADDICFSTTAAEFPTELAEAAADGSSSSISVGERLRAIFETYGFEINIEKLKIQPRTSLQKVTGIVVNKRLNVPRKFYDGVRCALHRWEMFGIDAAIPRHLSHLDGKRFSRSLGTCIGHIGKVLGKASKRYRVLLSRYRKLLRRDRS